MQTQQMPLLTFLGTPNVQYCIPIFQRVYSWTQRQCECLWDDIMRAGSRDEQHFMGIILHVIDTEGWHGYDQIDIVDGQQRLTTLSLLLIALAEWLDEHDETIDGIDGKTIRDTYLVLQGTHSVEGKLSLAFLDRYTLFALACDVELPEERAQRILDNHEYFCSRMREADFNPHTLWRGLSNLMVISTKLTGDDNAQLVFESLNSKGMPLSVADLVANQLLMEGDSGEQERLYMTYWKPLEDLVDVRDDRISISDIITAWLASLYRGRHIDSENEVYGVFKDHLNSRSGGRIEPALKELLEFARRFFDDDAFRADAQANATDWLGGKPVSLVSELKLFGS